MLRTRPRGALVSDYGFKTSGGGESRRGSRRGTRTISQLRGGAFGAGRRATGAVGTARNRLLRRSGTRTRRQSRGV